MTTPAGKCLLESPLIAGGKCPTPECHSRVATRKRAFGVVLTGFEGDCHKYPHQPTTPQEPPMANATSSTVTTVEHHYTFPTHPRGDMSDLGVAMSWARDKAKELGINTDYDDWAQIVADEESVSIVVKGTKKTSP